MKNIIASISAAISLMMMTAVENPDGTFNVLAAILLVITAVITLILIGDKE